MKITKNILLNIVSAAQSNIEKNNNETVMNCTKWLMEFIKEAPGPILEISSLKNEEPDICFLLRDVLFETIVNAAIKEMDEYDPIKTLSLQILQEIEKIPTKQIGIYCPNNYIFIKKWYKKDIEDAFSDAGIIFNEERYQKVLPDVLDILNDHTDTYDKIISMIEEHFPQKEDVNGLWKEFGKVKKDRISGRLKESWRHFPEGTSTETVWKWFEKEFHLHIEELIYR